MPSHDARVDPSSEESVSRALLAHLRVAAPTSDIRYAQPPSRIFGGNQSFVYGLEIEGDTRFSGPQVLRILRTFLPQKSVDRESAVQGALRALGYPVAHVGYACNDPSVLGGAFQLMERLPGVPVVGENSQGTIALRAALKDFRAFAFGPWPIWLADLQYRLHALPVDRIRAELENRGLDPDSISFARALESLAVRSESVRAEGLDTAFAWLRDQQHILDGRPLSLCHGDFFPNQILAKDGRVTGVIDWTDVCFAPAELDVVEVRIGLETLPVPFGSLGPRLVAARARRFYDAYCEKSPLQDKEIARYVEVLRCTRSMVAVAVAVAERRRALQGDGVENPNPYDDPRAISDFARRVRKITGCSVRLDEGRGHSI